MAESKIFVTGKCASAAIGNYNTINNYHYGCSDGANSQPNQNNPGLSTCISNCNEPVHSYFSRKKLDDEIQRIEKGKLKLLHGMSGTGKTSAALHYIFENQQKFAVSWFIDASGFESSILESLERLAKKLGVSYDELFRPTMKEKAAENEIIFLLDNLEEKPSCEWFKALWNIRSYVYIIATTNKPHLILPDAEPILVDKFDEALEFLDPLRSKNSEEDLLDLCRHFDSNILGLSVAKDYMLRHDTTASSYLKMQRDHEAAKEVRQTELGENDRILYTSVRTYLNDVDGDTFSAIAAISCISNNMIPEFLLSNLLSSSNPEDVNPLLNQARLNRLYGQLKSLVRITEESDVRCFSFHSFTQYVIRDMIDDQRKASLLNKLAGIFMKHMSKDNRFSREDFIQRTVRVHAEIFLEEWRNKEMDNRTIIALARLSELVGFTYTQQQPPLQQKLDHYFEHARGLLHKLCGVTDNDLQPAKEFVREIWDKVQGFLRRSPLKSSSDGESGEPYGITNNDLVVANQLYTKLSGKSLEPDIIEDLVFLQTVNKKDLHMFPEAVRNNQMVKEKFESSQPLSASDVSVLVENGAAYSVNQYRELFLPEFYLSVIYSYGRNYFYKNRETMKNPRFYLNLLKLAYCLSREISKRMNADDAVFHEFVVQTNGLLYLLVNDDCFSEDGKHVKKDAQVHARDLEIAIDRYQHLLRDERTFFEMGILKRTKDDIYSKLVCYQQMLRCYTNLISLKNGAEDQGLCIQGGLRLCDDLLKILGVDDKKEGKKKEDIVRYSGRMNAIAEFYLTFNQEEYYTRAIKIFAISAEDAEKYQLSLFYLEALVGLADVFSRNGKHRFSATQISIRHLIHCNSTESLREMQRQKPHIQQRIRKIESRNLAMVLKKCALLRREQERDRGTGSQCCFDECDEDSCDDLTTNQVSNDGSKQERFEKDVLDMSDEGRTRESSDGLQHEDNARNGTPQDPTTTVLSLETVDKTHEGSTGEKFVECQRVNSDKNVTPRHLSSAVLSSDTVPVDQTHKDNLMQQHLLKLAQNIPGQWKQLGIFLGVSDNKIEEISLNHRHDVSWQAYQMLTAWWSSHDEAAQSWCEKLANALRDIERHDLAKEFASELQIKLHKV